MKLHCSVILGAIFATFTTSAVARLTPLRRPALLLSRSPHAHEASIVERRGVAAALQLRGGADDEGEKKSGLSGVIGRITPTTRMYLLGCLAMAVLTLVGVPEELFLYEFGRTFKGGQLWRPITSALHLGKVDMGFASQLYFLILYGQEMERQDGSAQHCVFILTQVLFLMAVGTLTGYPSFARSLIAATIYCCSRREPMRPMEVQFGLRIEYWLLPYVNLIIDCLQAQSAAGAIPHLVGIFTGHIYHFLSIVWPELGGRRYLSAPGTLQAAFSQDKKKASGAAAKKSGTKKSKKSEPAAEEKKSKKEEKSSKSSSKSKKSKKAKKAKK